MALLWDYKTWRRVFGNPQSSQTAIPGPVWSGYKAAKRAPSFRDPSARAAKYARCLPYLRFPVARGEGIPSPETNADKKLARYSTISAVYLKYALKEKAGVHFCPLLADSGRSWQILSTFSRLFLAIISKQLLNFIWKNVWSVIVKKFKLTMAQFIRINGFH